MISKKIFFIIFLQFSLFANSVYNINFLDFQAKVFPKIILLDNNFEDKLLENSVVLTILYEEIDYRVVEILKDRYELDYKINEILIAGGSEKNADYKELGKVIANSTVKTAILIGKTGPKSYFLLGLEPGHHTLVSKAENDSLLNLITEAGKNYYVWQEVKMGLLLARSKLQLMSEAEGQAGVRESKLLEVNGASPVASVPVTKSEVATKPVEKTISQTALDPVVVAKQAEPTPVATVNASLPSPAPVASNNITKIERVPFEIGVSSVTVERIAKQNSCQSTKGAGLLYKKGPVEVYRVQCEDGREIKARCEMRQCEIFTP